MKIVELIYEQTMGTAGPTISSQSTTPPGQTTTQDTKKLDMTQGEILTLGRQINLSPQEVEALSRINLANKAGQTLTDPKSKDVLSKLGTMSLDPNKLKNLDKAPPLMGLIGKNQQDTATKQSTTSSATASSSSVQPNTSGIK